MNCLMPEIVDSRHARGIERTSIRTLSLEDQKENENPIDCPPTPTPESEIGNVNPVEFIKALSSPKSQPASQPGSSRHQ